MSVPASAAKRSSGLTPDALADLLAELEGALDPATLADLGALLGGFGGVLSPEVATAIVGQIVGLFGGLPAGDLSANQMVAVVTGLVSTLTTTLDGFGLGAVADLLQLLLTGLAGGDLDALDLADIGCDCHDALGAATRNR